MAHVLSSVVVATTDVIEPNTIAGSHVGSVPYHSRNEEISRGAVGKVSIILVLLNLLAMPRKPAARWKHAREARHNRTWIRRLVQRSFVTFISRPQIKSGKEWVVHMNALVCKA